MNHAFYYYRPQDLAGALRPILRRFAHQWSRTGHRAR